MVVFDIETALSTGRPSEPTTSAGSSAAVQCPAAGPRGRRRGIWPAVDADPADDGRPQHREGSRCGDLFITGRPESQRSDEQQGYTIIANMGDQPSDLDGGLSERTFLLPNPFYRIP
jgi:hypothetical protein